MWFNKKKNILVTGAKGQLGSYLVKDLTSLSFKKMSRIGQVFGIDIDELDLTDPFAVADFFNKDVADPSVKIDYVVHCAAATNTAAIEKDPLKFYAANVIGTKNVAESCAYNRIKMIHISTDYVFSELSYDGCGGRKIEFPVNQYGLQKLLAEKEAQLAYMKSGHPEHLVIGRLSWLFGNSQNSFVEKFLRSAFKTYAKSRKSSLNDKICHSVVDDAYGKPTPVQIVMSNVIDVIHGTILGNSIVDFQYNESAQISRFEWATMILNSFYHALKNSLLDSNDEILTILADMQERLDIVPVKSSELNLGMRHPGLVKSANAISHGNENYIKCTESYVERNIGRLANMMMDEIKEVK